MPEGDTVWQAARRLHDALAGKVLTRCDLRVPKYATADLTGRTVLDVTARGKHLLTRIEGGLTLHSHLRMDGAWKIYANGQRWTGGPAHQIRAILGAADRTAVGYRLPVLELLRTADEQQAVGHLGPDLLGPDWDAERALANLARGPRPPPRRGPPGPAQPRRHRQRLQERALLPPGRHPVASGRRAPRRPHREAARAREEAAGGQPRPPGPQHHRSPRPGPVRLRPHAPPLPALRHPDPRGRPGRRLPRAPDLLVPHLPDGPRPGAGLSPDPALAFPFSHPPVTARPRRRPMTAQGRHPATADEGRRDGRSTA